MQTTSLSELQAQWIKLHDDLGGVFERQKLAAPFVSIREEGDLGAVKSPILLVGKATKGDWEMDQFQSRKGEPLSKRLDERRQATLRHLAWRRTEDRRASAFWRFRSGLEKISQPVIWTNLAKIGAVKLNPHWLFLQKQSELAQQTLRAEIKEYRPVLVVLITNTFAAQEIAHPVFGPKDVWQRSSDDAIWWRARSQTQPAVLWVDHPQGKANDKLHRWLEMAHELVH